MKKISLFVWLCLLCCIGMRDIYANANAGTCRLLNGTIVTIWVTQDADGPWRVWGATGSFGSDPSTWITQEITVPGATCISVTTPTLTVNPISGYAISTWEYFDQTFNVMRLAAALLPTGTIWTSQAISDVTTESSCVPDQSVTLDNHGNVMVTWSAFNASLQTSVVRGVTGTISHNVISWDNSFLLPGAGYPDSTGSVQPPAQPVTLQQKPETKPAVPQLKPEDVRLPTKIRNN